MRHEKSTFNVLFYLRKNKVKKSALIPIHVRITVDGQNTQFNTKLTISESCWKSGKVTGKSLEAGYQKGKKSRHSPKSGRPSRLQSSL